MRCARKLKAKGDLHFEYITKRTSTKEKKKKEKKGRKKGAQRGLLRS